ncbi:MAG: lipopolysaccharide kinase InaA family protein, partial [Azoarcus sp.]|nr:lipopolysaccharide kinase InaA family protein [Azoarcus sp.]
LEDRAYYLKRQSNHLTRSFAHPCGEPTFAREFRAIERLRSLGVPTPNAAFFACRKLPANTSPKAGECAILLTNALDGWQAMNSWLAGWETFSEAVRMELLAACGKIARKLHASGLIHGCFYPTHIFLREAGEGFDAALIDLEKVRPAWRSRYDRQRDLDQFFRHASVIGKNEADALLAAYLACAPESQEVADWRQRLSKRRTRKENGGLFTAWRGPRS